MVQDTCWKEYLSDDERYADLINGICFGGRQIIVQSDLQELDTQTGMFHGPQMVQSLWNGRKRGNLKVRDSLRRAAFGINYAVVGIENQEVIDYSMPLRNLSYDAGEYEKQAAIIRKEIKKYPNGLTAGEYLYGFRKDSRMYPTVTLILYSGTEAWDGPESLHEMLDFTDIPKELRKMVPDYRINLVEIRKIKDTSIFKTDIRQVFDFIRYSENRAVLEQLVKGDIYYKNMPEDAFRVAAHYTNATELIAVKDYYGGEGKKNMCGAIAEMIEEGRAEGREEGELRVNRLIELLIEQSREKEIKKAVKSRRYQQRLFKEFGL